MVRCVAVFLCLATSQGLRVTKPNDKLKGQGSEEEMQSVLVAAARNGLTYPAVCDLMVADSDELFDLPGEEAVLIYDPSVPAGQGDMNKMADSLKMEQKVLKQGDGKTFPAEGDTVKWRMTGTQKLKNYHDTNFDSVLGYEYPLPKMPPVNGQKNPINVTDQTILFDMSLGSIKQIDTMVDTKQGKLKNTIQVELLEVIKKGPAIAETIIMEQKPSPKETFIRNLEKQSAQGLTMTRKVVKEGDGKTFVKPGDTITLRVLGSGVQSCGKKCAKKIDSESTSTFEYPLLATPFKTKFNGMDMPVKFGWDQKLIPGMSQGEIHHVEFAPVMGQKIPPFKVELVKVIKGN